MFIKVPLLAVLALGLATTSANAALVLMFGENSTSSNDPMTGASAQIELSFSDTSIGEVQMTGLVTNTTGDVIFGAGATESTLTGFALNVFGGASFIDGSFVAGSYLDTLISPVDAQPFGPFDLAAADNSNYNGGNANAGLATGVSDTFSMSFSTGLLDAFDLEGAFYSGLMGENTSAVRFQQVNAGAGSDKLINPDVVSSVVPLPAAGWMLLAGVGGLAAMRRRRKKT